MWIFFYKFEILIDLEIDLTEIILKFLKKE